MDRIKDSGSFDAGSNPAGVTIAFFMKLNNIFIQSNDFNINLSKLLLRISVAIFMLSHGITKIINFNELINLFPNSIGLGSEFSIILVIFAEVFCSVLIFIGFITRLAAIPEIITMLVVSFLYNNSISFAEIELPLLYFLIFIIVLILGPGKYSIDYLIFRQKNNDI